MLLPGILNAANFSRPDVEIARDCLEVKNQIKSLAKLQSDEDCEGKLNNAEFQVDYATGNLIHGDHDGAKLFLNYAHHSLLYASILNCIKPDEINIQDSRVLKIIEELA